MITYHLRIYMIDFPLHSLRRLQPYNYYNLGLSFYGLYYCLHRRIQFGARATTPTFTVDDHTTSFFGPPVRNGARVKEMCETYTRVVTKSGNHKKKAHLGNGVFGAILFFQSFNTPFLLCRLTCRQQPTTAPHSLAHPISFYNYFGGIFSFLWRGGLCVSMGILS